MVLDGLTSHTPATISNWLQNLAFVALVNLNKKVMLDKARNKLTDLAGNSMDALEKILEGDNDNARIQACKLILSANGLVGDGESGPYYVMG